MKVRVPSVAAVIPARKGSKRILNKNFRDINGRPAVSIIIDKLASTKLFDKIIVSTDLQEIPVRLKKYEQHFYLRKEDLSDDHTSLVDVMAFETTRLASMGNYDYVLCALPTAFAFTEEDLPKSLSILVKDKQADYITCIKRFDAQIERALVQNKNNSLGMKNPENFLKRSQDCEKLYHDVGQFYWGKTSAWQNRTPFFVENTLGFTLKSNFVFDIDEPEDWFMAEQLFKCGLWS